MNWCYSRVREISLLSHLILPIPTTPFLTPTLRAEFNYKAFRQEAVAASGVADVDVLIVRLYGTSTTFVSLRGEGTLDVVGRFRANLFGYLDTNTEINNWLVLDWGEDSLGTSVPGAGSGTANNNGALDGTTGGTSNVTGVQIGVIVVVVVGLIIFGIVIVVGAKLTRLRRKRKHRTYLTRDGWEVGTVSDSYGGRDIKEIVSLTVSSSYDGADTGDSYGFSPSAYSTGGSYSN